MLTQEHDRPRELTAHGDALSDPEHDEGEGGGRADALVGGQDADQEGGHAHGQHRDHEGWLASRLVAEISEQRATHRPRREPDGEDAERGEERGHWIVGREEQLPDDRGEGAVDGEVVPLEHAADRPGGAVASELARVRRGGYGGHTTPRSAGGRSARRSGRGFSWRATR